MLICKLLCAGIIPELQFILHPVQPPPAKNKKAYSYFGTICKNYLMGQIQKDQKETNRKVSYEDISATLENRPDMVYYLEFEKMDAEKIIDIFLNENITNFQH